MAQLQLPTSLPSLPTSMPSLPSAEEAQRYWYSLPDNYRAWILWGLAALVALLVLRKLWNGLARAIRRRRPPNIHPLLQKYNVDQAELDRKHRQLAEAIVATSTGNRLAGFRIVRQVEAVFVEGYRTPEDAIIALKATAADRGANAVLNVKTERTVAGRCTASGDAVFVARLLPRPTAPEAPPSPPVPPPASSGPPQEAPPAPPMPPPGGAG